MRYGCARPVFRAFQHHTIAFFDHSMGENSCCFIRSRPGCVHSSFIANNWPRLAFAHELFKILFLIKVQPPIYFSFTSVIFFDVFVNCFCVSTRSASAKPRFQFILRSLGFLIVHSCPIFYVCLSCFFVIGVLARHYISGKLHCLLLARLLCRCRVSFLLQGLLPLLLLLVYFIGSFLSTDNRQLFIMVTHFAIPPFHICLLSCLFATSEV